MNISYDELLLHGVSMIFVVETLIPVLGSIVLRGVCAVCCHVLYCAPYSCIAALHTQGGNPFAALRHMDFWAGFLLSVLVHALWNAPFGGLLLKLPAATALLWLSCRYGVRKSFGGSAPAWPPRAGGPKRPARSVFVPGYMRVSLLR